jgi:hypothetical protein
MSQRVNTSFESYLLLCSRSLDQPIILCGNEITDTGLETAESQPIAGFSLDALNDANHSCPIIAAENMACIGSRTLSSLLAPGTTAVTIGNSNHGGHHNDIDSNECSAFF